MQHSSPSPKTLLADHKSGPFLPAEMQKLLNIHVKNRVSILYLKPWHSSKNVSRNSKSHIFSSHVSSLRWITDGAMEGWAPTPDTKVYANQVANSSILSWYFCSTCNQTTRLTRGKVRNTNQPSRCPNPRVSFQHWERDSEYIDDDNA